MEFENEEKLKSFLKKESNRLGISIQNTYNTYFTRLLLERISKLCYDKLYVKGSMSEFAHLNEMIRPITDLDLVSTEYHNDPLLILYIPVLVCFGKLVNSNEMLLFVSYIALYNISSGSL